MSIPFPPITRVTQDDLEKRLADMVPHFTPEWTASADDGVGSALVKIFSFLTQETLDRLNRTPQRNLLAFLDVLGIRLLPKTPAIAYLRFHVTDGVSGPIIIPARTLVSASSPGGDVPFETEENLSANSGSIVGLFAIDPINDAIYQPPSGFLQKSIVSPRLPSYTTSAFSSAGSQSIQLELIDGIAPGDTLRITGSDYVVKELKGLLVQLIQPLLADVNQNTTVSKRTTFELFNGINLQEHALYLSHSEYFKLKEATVVALKAIAAEVGDVTDVVWEFFTEDPQTKLASWKPLSTSQDDSAGLSKTGIIQLIKPAGEIKETNVGGQTGRWIRARRNAPIAPLDRLSKLESVMIKVSAQASFVPDAAFYNESPLSVTVPPFNPLGFEPQLFDRFHIASQEAFSKIGARVQLNFKLDLSRMLGGPAAVLAPTTLFRVFARGVLARLTEVAFSRTEFLEVSGATAPAAGGAFPAAVALAGFDLAGVFIRCNDGTIQLLRKSSLLVQDGWTILDKPGGSEVSLDPAAVAIPNGPWIVFAVVDGNIWHKTISPVGGAGQPWRVVGNLGLNPKSAPAVALVDGTNAPVLFVFDDQDKLWRVRFVWSSMLSDWEGQAGEPFAFPDTDAYKCSSAQAAHPVAVDGLPGSSDPCVFFLNKAGGITGVRSVTEAQVFAHPDPTLTAIADPACIPHVDSTGNLEFLLFAPLGAGGHVYSFSASTSLASGGNWTLHANPQPVSGRPCAVALFGTQYRLFAASGQGSMLQLAGRTESGLVKEADPQRFLFLSPNPAPSTGYPRYALVHPASGAEQLLELVEPFAGPSLALFASPGVVQALPATTAYDLFELLEADTTDSGSIGVAIILDAASAVATGADLWLLVGTTPPQFAPIHDIAGTVVTLNNAFSATPGSGVPCQIFRFLQSGSTPVDTKNRVLLDAEARNFPGAYQDADIRIGSAVTQIMSYDALNRVVELQNAIGSTGNVYDFPEKWSQIQDPALDDIEPVLSWEYWNGAGWASLKSPGKDSQIGRNFVEDDTQDLVREGTVSFVVPPDIARTEVAGQLNYWIRARLVGGSYGQVKFETVSTTADGVTTFKVERKDFSRPPIVKDLNISYRLEAERPPQVLLTLNNLDFVDQTAASATIDKSFQPFVRLDTSEKSVYLGLDQRISSGSLLVTLQDELPLSDQRKWIWEALFENQFREIEVKDKTGVFTQLAGLIGLNIPFVAEKRQMLGIPAFWTRARLLQEDWPQAPELSGVFLNAVKAKQLRTYLREVLGPSDGTPGQQFQFQHAPVEEEEIRIRTLLTDRDREKIIAEDGDDAIQDVLDGTGRIMETWVRWKEVVEFFDSSYDSRVYRLDRASGELQFGDRIHGMVPPIGGDNIRAFRYRSGGGTVGDVEADAIKSLVSAIAGIDLVSNPLPSSGGSEEATRDEMLDFGPAELNHRDRAVAPTDYEWLARRASRQVVKARCVPNRDDAGLHNPGWVSVYIVAASQSATPRPPLALCNLVRSELLKSAPTTLACSGRLFVGPPDYVAVSVKIKVAASSIAQVAQVEANTRQALQDFLHPLTGGPDGNGWDFGQGLAMSAVYSRIEQLSGVDHVETLSITPAPTDDFLQIKPDQLLASGVHDITTVVANEDEAWR